MRALLNTGLTAADHGWLPDVIIRSGIRRLCHQREVTLTRDSGTSKKAYLRTFISEMNRSDIAPVPVKANDQHYELPPAFFDQILGDHRKYSCCYWAGAHTDLADAEEAALKLSCHHALIENGHSILELGCGWGSLSLWMAKTYPNSIITSISNSIAQRHYIEAKAHRLGLSNLTVKTRDINEYVPDSSFDRIVSVEMFEHLRNYREMFERISRWLPPRGRLFLHIFSHAETPYLFVDEGPGDWMSRHFFTAGMMPSHELPMTFRQHLAVEESWRWNGQHYRQTAESWLINLDRNRREVMAVLEQVYGLSAAKVWFQRWRIFFMACAELFAANEGETWGVSHYRFRANA